MYRPMIIRHSKPSKLDQACFGTECKVVTTLSKEYDIYRQMSMNEENPLWVYIETVHKNFDVPS